MIAEKSIFQVRLASIRYEAENIHSFELRALPGSVLPPFTAGAHIDLHLINGLVRSYSLLNSQSERHRYIVAVQKDGQGRGGSRLVHESLRVGDSLTISGPRNNFPLIEDAAHSVFIAGGIGITPVLAMIDRLTEIGRSWQLFYTARTRANAAFLKRLTGYQDYPAGAVRINFDREAEGRLLDVEKIVAEQATDTHLYCCGPLPMLQAFEQAASSRPSEAVHVEYFVPKDAPALAGGFDVTLERSGRTLRVEAGKTILDTILEAGLEVPYSCLQGVCGACETVVIAGEPDHRDTVLTKAEMEANKTMMICCSGSKSSRLVLDI